MADIINFAEWAAMQEMIAQGNAMVSGMTAAEAQAALGASANSGLYVYNNISASGAGNIINFPNAASAAEAAAQYAASGGTTSASGAATAASGAAEQTANLALTQGGVAGILSMNVPSALAALAPAAGVAIGAGFWQLVDPTVLEPLKATLQDYFMGDSESVGVMVDANGNTYFPKAAVEAMQAYVNGQGWLVSGTHYTPLPNTATATKFPEGLNGSSQSAATGTLKNGMTIYQFTYAVISSSAPVMWFQCAESSSATGDHHLFAFSTQPFDLFYSRTIDTWTTTRSPIRQGDNAYVYDTTGWEQAGADMYDVNVPLTAPKFTVSDLVRAMRETTEETHQDMPEGVSPWTGTPYPASPTPLQVLTGYDENNNPIYTPYYPVSVPIGDPGVSNNPTTNPDPTVNPTPAPAVNPWVSPTPAPALYPQSYPDPYSNPTPLPNPLPSPQPVPSPSTDPTSDPEEVPDDPPTPNLPVDTGTGDNPLIPVIPVLPSAASGLLHVYNPTQAQIDAFGSWLWTTFSGNLIDTLSKLFNDPMDAVIGLHELYATPATSGSTTIRAGFLDSEVPSLLVGSRYTTINCGSVVVEEYYQNYLDYSPYVQCYIYLPFIGIMPVSADDIIGNAVNIVYHIDSYTGSCIAVITVAKNGYSSPVYQFEGNCAVEIPITSGYQSSLMSGLLAVAGTAISGSTAIGLTAAHVGRAGLGKNTVQHSGSFGSSYGAMGAKVPYIIVRRPVQKKVLNYSKSYGYPAHKMVFVGNCTGYLRAREVRVKSTTATNIEKEMIVNALKSGVYVK